MISDTEKTFAKTTIQDFKVISSQKNRNGEEFSQQRTSTNIV